MQPTQVLVREQHGTYPRLTAYFVGGSHGWDEEWANYTPDQIRVVMEYYRRSPVIYSSLIRYLPHNGEIVEAGSGLGFWVELMVRAGYQVHGLDNSGKALERAKKSFPHLRFEHGDVLRLPYPEASLSGYVSFGVAEHFRDGPHLMLREAARVLRKDGVMILTVPRLSPLRRLQPFRPAEAPSGARFYQYFFSRAEISSFVTAEGFEPLAFSSFGVLKTLRDELRAFRRPVPSDSAPNPETPASDPAPRKPSLTPSTIGFGRKALWHTQNLLLDNGLNRRLAGHMMLLVAKRV